MWKLVKIIGYFEAKAIELHVGQHSEVHQSLAQPFEMSIFTCLSECSPLKQYDDVDNVEIAVQQSEKQPSVQNIPDESIVALDVSNEVPISASRSPNKKLQRLIDIITIVRRNKPALIQYLRKLRRNSVIVRYLKNLGRRLGIAPRLWKLIMKEILEDLRPRSTKAPLAEETTTPDLMRPPPKMLRKIVEIICATSKICDSTDAEMHMKKTTAWRINGIL
ncbi:unnamed protein product [Owenia fusiformis]|uniref:Uncharacterized protein n=1 Tax=Owenia fusiformis TaxID=6347 RepID=A0A8S4NMS9_OWEFU|nr:unnamed protein product [Owenia fusiformis]